MIIEILELLLMLIGSHFICDYVLQTDAIATGKNRLLDPAKFGVNWYYWMTSHIDQALHLTCKVWIVYFYISM